MESRKKEELTSYRKKLRHIFESGDFSDVTFLVGDPSQQRKFNLHKLILSLSSDVFATMFYGSLPEKNEVEITDIEPDIFQIMVKYIYEESFSVVSIEEAIYTYCAAEKYNVADLRNVCIVFINDNLSPENLPIVYRNLYIVDHLQIKSKCKEIISNDTSKILEGTNFLDSPLDMMKDIVETDTLNIESEVKLFEYLLKWAESTCDKQGVEKTEKSLRKIVDPLLPYINFLGMNIDDFLSGPGNSNLLTDSEVASISKNLIRDGLCALPSWCNTKNFRTLIQGENCCNSDNAATPIVLSQRWGSYEHGINDKWECGFIPHPPFQSRDTTRLGFIRKWNK